MPSTVWFGEKGNTAFILPIFVSIQLPRAEELGLGTRDYRLETV